MSFFQRIREAIGRFMTGRNGVDQLSLALVIAGLVLSLVGSMTGLLILQLLSTAVYVWSLFRIFSRNIDKRYQENEYFLNLKTTIPTKWHQFIVRRKNSKEYKYFRCPGCRSLMRLKRGRGEVDMTCPKCGRQFKQKS